MAKRNSKADHRLRKIKMQHQQEIRRLKTEFGEQLLGVERLLQPLLHSQTFYHEALMNLLTSPDEPGSDTLIGALGFQRWIHHSGQQLHKTLITYRRLHFR